MPMRSLRIDLLGCYGIRSLDEQFDLSDGRRHVAVYASNGVMKSSLARRTGRGAPDRAAIAPRIAGTRCMLERVF